jgi:hypothetical protein
MATWKPKADDPVGGSETVGRRLFDEPKLSGGQDQRPYSGLDLRNFIERRDPQFSIDRLGRSNIEEKILKYLFPRALHQARRFTPPRRFDGWATLQVKHLLQPPAGLKSANGDGVWPVSASPIDGSLEPLEDNAYHAHITTPQQDPTGYSNALRLRELFTQKGAIRKSGETVSEGVSWASKLRRGALGVLNKVRVWLKSDRSSIEVVKNHM